MRNFGSVQASQHTVQHKFRIYRTYFWEMAVVLSNAITSYGIKFDLNLSQNECVCVCLWMRRHRRFFSKLIFPIGCNMIGAGKKTRCLYYVHLHSKYCRILNTTSLSGTQRKKC